MSVDLLLTLVGLCLGVAACVYSSHRAGLPRDDMRPKRLPWQFFIVLSGFATFLMLVHLVNILGYETGPGKGLLGGRFGGV